MATLEDLLALLPDNDTGAIDAADLRTVVTELWNNTSSLEARLTALEAGGGEISYNGIWQFNPQTGGTPQAMQVTVDVIPITSATWARFWPVDLTNQDMRNFLLTAEKLYVQNEADANNWAYYDVAGEPVDMGTYIQVPISVLSSAGSSSSSQWQRVLVVMTMPSAVE